MTRPEHRNAKQHKTAAALQVQCDAFNSRWPVGSSVMLKKDFLPEPVETKTRSEAQVLSGHSAVIWLDGVSGCYALDCVTPIEATAAQPAGSDK